MAGSRPQVQSKSKGRSRMTNGYDFPRGVDTHSQWARRFRDLYSLHLADMAGSESEAEKAILRRACILITELERMEAGFAIAGKAQLAELEVYQRAANSMKRMLEAVGLQRRAKEIGPTLGDLIRQDQERQRERLVDEQDAAATSARDPP
jgi:hypothetical protein